MITDNITSNDISASDSILSTIKQMLGVTNDYTAFDISIIAYINSAFAILKQIGVGDGVFTINGYEETWEDFMSTENDANIADVVPYIYLKVRMLFDPPANGSIAQMFKDNASELEWRLNVEADDYEHLGGDEITWENSLKEKQDAGIWQKDGDADD